MAGFFFVSYLVIYALTAALVSGQRAVNSRQETHCHHGVFYDTLGCFTRDYPYNNTPQLPQNPDFVDTSFHLYTRSNRHTPQTFSTRNRGQNIGGSNLNAELTVKVLVHGFLQNDRSPWILEMTHTLLQHDDLNVITVNWGSGAGFPYAQAAANTRVAGAELARLISLLGEQRGVSARKIHLIGHSLGAHVAGHAGRTLRGSLGRITGLDPADPNFSFQPPEIRLDPTDARYVDVIHTDGGPFTNYGGYGTLQAMGHIDFYPNGGRDQPGCHTDTSIYSFMENAYQQGMTNAEYSMACSHDRSIFLFLKSITSPCPFTAYPCTNEDDFRTGQCLRCGNRPCPSMGYRADLYKRTGTFYLDTLSHNPFCGYHYLVRATLDSSMTSVSGDLHVQITGDRGHTSQPLLLHRGEMSAGDIVSSVMLASEDVGHVTSATLTFTPSSGYYTWLLMSSSSVKVTDVMVEGVNRRNTVYFSPTAAEVQEGQPLQLNGGSRTPVV